MDTLDVSVRHSRSKGACRYCGLPTRSGGDHDRCAKLEHTTVKRKLSELLSQLQKNVRNPETAKALKRIQCVAVWLF